MMQPIEVTEKIDDTQLSEKEKLIKDLARARAKVAELEAERLQLFRENLTAQIADFVLPMLAAGIQDAVRKIDDQHYHATYQVAQLVAVLNARYPLPRNVPPMPPGGTTLSAEEIARIKAEADRHRSFAPLHRLIGSAGPSEVGTNWKPDTEAWETQVERDQAELAEKAQTDTGIQRKSNQGPGVHQPGGIKL